MGKKSEALNKKNKLSVESYKGVRDFYPQDQAFLKYLFATCRSACERFGYAEYSASILEPSELYKAKGAANEEIINEHTYTFLDRGQREVTLRPEMTPTVARMVAAKRRELGFPLRLFSIPNLFRYERPQRGRLREHWQLNVDLFGSHSSAADREIISLAHELMQAFGAKGDEDFFIHIGSRSYVERIIASHNLSSSEAQMLFALLDRKNKMPKEEFAEKLQLLGVPESAFSGEEVPDDILDLIEQVQDLGVTTAIFDPSIVRGFNYYTGMVFEVYDNHPDNNRALFGGGRYDNLTALFDDEPIPGIGFGMGDVTIRDFLAVRNMLPPYISSTKVYVALTNPTLALRAQLLCTTLRKAGVNVEMDFGEKKLADQIKTATKHQIPYLVVMGENERQSGEYTVRNLESGEEEKVLLDDLAEYFITLL